jgi:hypothetical protein
MRTEGYVKDYGLVISKGKAPLADERQQQTRRASFALIEM